MGLPEANRYCEASRGDLSGVGVLISSKSLVLLRDDQSAVVATRANTYVLLLEN